MPCTIEVRKKIKCEIQSEREMPPYKKKLEMRVQYEKRLETKEK